MKAFSKKGSLHIATVTKAEYLRKARETLEEIAETSKNHFLEGFRKGGYQTNASAGGWQQRQETDAGRAILVKSGALRRDIDVKRITKNSVIIGTNRIQYAAAHNEGLEVPERRARGRKALKMKIGGETIYRKSAAGFKMPKREFIGQSDQLNKKNSYLISEFLKSLLLSK